MFEFYSVRDDGLLFLEEGHDALLFGWRASRHQLRLLGGRTRRRCSLLNLDDEHILGSWVFYNSCLTCVHIYVNTYLYQQYIIEDLMGFSCITLLSIFTLASGFLTGSSSASGSSSLSKTASFLVTMYLWKDHLIDVTSAPRNDRCCLLTIYL